MTAISVLSYPDRRRTPQGAAVSGYIRTTRLIRTREELDAVAPQWAGLEERAPSATLFQGLGWARAVFDFEAARGNRAFDPVIVSFIDGRRLVGLLPLERVRVGLRLCLLPLGHAFVQYSGILLAPGYAPGEVVPRMIEAARTSGRCDVIRFLKVPEGSALALGLPQSRVETGAVQGAPCVALDGYADYAAYFQTISAKTRKNMRNARNRLEREAPLEHHVAAGNDEILGVIQRTITGRAERLRDQGLTSRAFGNAGFADFCRSLVGRKDINLMAMSLRHGGEPVAEQWGFVHAGRYYAFVASRDFAHSDESPGKLHLGEVIHACADRGIMQCDLGVPAMPYKLTWATHTVNVHDYALPVTLQGWLVVRLWDGWLRPAAKSLVMSMPTSLRSVVMRFAGRGR